MEEAGSVSRLARGGGGPHPGRPRRGHALHLGLAAFLVLGSGLASGGGVARAAGRQSRPPTEKTLTMASSGHRFTVVVGTTIVVDLPGRTLDWTAPASGTPRILKATEESTARDGSVRADFSALRAGVASLSAAGTPHCGKGAACPQFIVLWRVVVAVVAAPHAKVAARSGGRPLAPGRSNSAGNSGRG